MNYRQQQEKIREEIAKLPKRFTLPYDGHRAVHEFCECESYMTNGGEMMLYTLVYENGRYLSAVKGTVEEFKQHMKEVA